MIENGNYITKWKHEWEMENGSMDKVRELQQELRKRFEETAMELSDTKCGALDNLSVIVNNERYKII